MKYLQIALLSCLLSSAITCPLMAEESFQKVDIDNTSIPIQFKMIDACMFGDFDLIRKDMENDIKLVPQTELFLTIEEIGNKSSSVYKSLTKFEVEKVSPDFKVTAENPKPVKTTTFELKNLIDISGSAFSQAIQDQSDKVFALYLCRSTRGSKTCSDKVIRSYADNFKRYEVIKTPGSEKFSPKYPEIIQQSPIAPDLVYFLAPLVVSKGNLYFVNQTWTTETTNQILEKFPEINKSDLEYLSEKMFILGNFPLSYDQDGNISIKLLTNNPDKC